MKLLPLALLMAAVGCAADGITTPPPTPPPAPPPPVVSRGTWDVTGSVTMESLGSPPQVLTGVQVRVNGQLVWSYAGTPRSRFAIPFTVPHVPGGETVEVAIRITGQDAPEVEYQVLGALTAISPFPASERRTMPLKEQRVLAGVGSLVTVQFAVPPY